MAAQASDGAEAIALAAELKPDPAVLDLTMPGTGGMETAAAIRARSPRTRIVALSMGRPGRNRRVDSWVGSVWARRADG